MNNAQNQFHLFFIIVFQQYRLQEAFQYVMHPQDRNCWNEILQTNFDIRVRSTHIRHTHHIIFALLKWHILLIVKYAENAIFNLPFTIEYQPKRSHIIKKKFYEQALLYILFNTCMI